MDEQEIITGIIRQALAEDLGRHGDITSKAVFTSRDHAQAVIKSKDHGILSGVYLIQPLFSALDTTLFLNISALDGEQLEPGREICRIQGQIQSILAGERTILNFLQHLSGIATQTARMVSLLHGTAAVLLDTRKTTPTLRLLEKKAVQAGGGTNHRFGLYDMILIKDTHVKAAGGPAAAIRKAKEFRRHNPSVAIEVEVQTIDECSEALGESPDRIMLDNMVISDIAACVAMVKGSNLPVQLEASGNITQDTIKEVARTGVDYISSGSITHSVKALDIHLIIL